MAIPVPAPDIVEFVTDPRLLGLGLSPAQEALLRAVYALPMNAEQLDLFRECTGRADPPTNPFQEVCVIAGARSGKDSRIAGPIVCYEALFGGHEAHMHKGERGVIPLVAQDLRATRIAFSYIRHYLTESPLLTGEVEEVLASEIALRSGMAILCFPCTQRSLRGWSIPAAVMDELAFFRLEGAADSDVEIQASIRRGMVGFPQTRLVKISTPYMKSGVLYEDWQRFGEDDPLRLVWKAPSKVMNPLLAARLERERQLDPLRFAREYEAEFAEDLDAFLPAAWVEGAIVTGRHELPPGEGIRYTAAVDPSGGGADTFTLAVAHREGRGMETRVVLDTMRGWRRVGDALSGVVREIAEKVRCYGLAEVIGDRYAAGWVRERFAEAGVRYREAEADKSVAYLELEPLFAQGRIELLNHPDLVHELRNLERRRLTGGRIRVDHPHGGHDDFANALALAAFEGSRRTRYGIDYGIDAAMR